MQFASDLLRWLCYTLAIAIALLLVPPIIVWCLLFDEDDFTER